MTNEEILNLWDCNKITCGEAIESARADERLKTIDECMSKCVETINECLSDVLTPYAIKRIEHDLQKIIMELKGEQK